MKKTDSRNSLAIPKQARAKQSRDEIFRAAEAVFAEKGPAGARVDEIAEKSGINKQRIYAYFGSKDELYRRVLLKVYSEAATNQSLLELTENDLGQMSSVIIRVFLKFHSDHPRFWRLLSWENLNGGKSLTRSDWNKLRSEYIEHLQKLYRIGQNKGIFSKNVDFTTYLLLIFSFTFFYYSNQLTISNLLDLKLERSEIRRKIEEQLELILKSGIIRTG
jgi:TetR/AcrR family transcriptional regulator